MSADIVEVAPAYDTNAELTTMAAADVSFSVLFFYYRSRSLSLLMQVLFEVLSVMTKTPLGKVASKSTD